jgi:hypothetical protein
MRLTGRNFPPLWRRLLAAIAERTPKRVTGARQRRGPDGVNITATGSGGGGYVVHPWQMSVEPGNDEAAPVKVRFRRGLVNGVEAKIGDRFISAEDEAGETPFLEVSGTHYDTRRIARIYAKVEFEGFAWFTKAVTLTASATVPEVKPFIMHKLVGILVKSENGDVLPEARAYFDFRVTPVDRTKDGAALYLVGPV